MDNGLIFKRTASELNGNAHQKHGGKDGNSPMTEKSFPAIHVVPRFENPTEHNYSIAIPGPGPDQSSHLMVST